MRKGLVALFTDMVRNVESSDQRTAPHKTSRESLLALIFFVNVAICEDLVSLLIEVQGINKIVFLCY